MSMGLYIHIPFCIGKCNYCDFTSAPPAAPGEIENYLLALAKELEIYGRLLARPDAACSVDTVYIGGGTPTLLAGEQLVRVLIKCRDLFAWSADTEVTVEANPGTVDLLKLEQLKMAGVNRISFGVQSFDDSLLRAMGRVHSAALAVESIALARKAGFFNLNLDLIFGLPGQTMGMWEQTLDEALKLEVEHLSLYGLKIEPGTPWGEEDERGLLPLPPEETVLKMRAVANEKLKARGYRQYEISNYARPGFEARHNLRYWHNKEYLGVGLGASSHLLNRRFVNISSLSSYSRLLESGQLPIAEEELLTWKQRMGETAFLGLRLLAGLDSEAFYLRYGIRPQEAFKAEIEHLLQLGLLEEQDNSIRLTAQGLPVANHVFTYFV